MLHSYVTYRPIKRLAESPCVQCPYAAKCAQKAKDDNAWTGYRAVVMCACMPCTECGIYIALDANHVAAEKLRIERLNANRKRRRRGSQRKSR